MQFKNMSYFWIVLVFLTLLSPIQGQEPEKILLEQIVKLTLEPQVTKTYKFIIDKQFVNETQLYVTAQSPFNDPYQIPEMIITSDKNYRQLCYDAASQLTDVCSIPTKELTMNRQFLIEVKCVVKCNLQISAYSSQVLQLDIGDTVIIGAMQDFGVAQAIQIQVPEKAQFTQVLIEAYIINIDDVEQGITLNVNYGKYSNTQVPTMETYQIRGQSTWNDGVGVSLSQQQIKGGEWIKILLYATEKMKIKFTSSLVNGIQYPIELNQQKYDIISYSEGRIYTLDLTNFVEQIKDDNIDIFFTIYSGTPDIIIAFDKSFPTGQIVTNDYISGTINCLISPQIRKQLNFKGMVYIKVQGFWTSSYKLFILLNKKDFVPLGLQSTQITELFKGEQIQNYLYEETLFVGKDDKNKSKVMRYVLKVEMIQGNAMFGLRRCSSFEQEHKLTCLLNDIKQLQIPETVQTFTQIDGEVQRSYMTYEIRFSYNFQKCHSISNVDGITYNCAFQFIATYDNSTLNKTNFAITLYKRQLSIALKEGQIVKDTVDKGSYHFFSFRLPSKQNISEVSFFITTIQGDCMILGSNNYEFPTIFELGSKNISLSTNNVLSFTNITQTVFYLSVYGYQKSDYTLTTVVQRFKKNKTDSESEKATTAIKLKQNVVQQYTIAQNRETLIFSLIPQKNVMVRIAVNSLEGVVTFKVVQVILENNKSVNVPVKCQNQGDICQFRSSKDDFLQYRVIVTGNISQTQIFTIGFRYPDSHRCLQFPMNALIMIDMKKSQKFCISYLLKEPKELQILTSLSSLKLISGSVTATLKIANRTIQIQEHSVRVTSDEVVTACNGNGILDFNPCPLVLEFVSTDDISFQTVVQESDTELILFDGFPQKVSTNSLNSNGKSFYYQIISKQNDVKVYFSSYGVEKYRIIGKIVDEAQYLQSNVSLFPTKDTKPGPNILFRETTGKMTIMKFKMQDIKHASCTHCLLFLTVYKINGLDQDNAQFKIQVTQKGSRIDVGESKIGYVEEGQIYEYTVSTKNLTGGLFTVTSTHDDNCVGVFMEQDKALQNKSNEINSYRSYISLPHKDKKYKIYVKGFKECSFQVSFSSNEKPIHESRLSLPQTITLTNSSITYLLYYHETNQTFRIVQNIESGDSRIAVRPIKGQEKLADVLLQKMQTYPFGDVEGAFIDLTIRNQHEKFCFKCYYIIAVQGFPNLKENIIILTKDALIPLKQNSILKDRLQIKEPKNYVYHSINSFNLTIGVLYGQLNIKVTTPGGNVVINDQISTTKSYLIKHPKETQDYFIDLFDDSSKFLIETNAQTNTGYYIQIIKNNIMLRIKQGLPTLVELNDERQTVVQFINYSDGKNVNILVQALVPELLQPSSIIFTIQGEDKTQIIGTKILQSENSFNIQLSTYSNVFLIKMKLSHRKSMNVSLMIIRQKMTHLVSSHENLFKHEGIFQIFNNNKSLMIQIFNCKGEVEIHASSNYSVLKDDDKPGEIVMERANYGGHYVITAQSKQGEYFLQTINRNRKRNKNKNKQKQGEDLLYVISYYFYQSIDMPYKRIAVENDKIKSQQAEKSRVFMIDPVMAKQSKNSNFSVASITYQLLISTDQKLIQQYSQCSLGAVHKQTMTISNHFENQDTIIFPIQNQKLVSIMGQNIKSFYVGAVAVINLHTIQSSPNYPTSLTYIYDYSQVTLEGQIADDNKSKTYFVWIVLPFLLASFFLMLACRYCIRRIYASYYPTALIEEDNYGPSDDAFKQNANQ